MSRRSQQKKSSNPKKIFLILAGTLLVILIGVGALGAKVLNDVKNTADIAYEPVDRQNTDKTENVAVPKNDADLNQGDSFSVLLLGVDTGSDGRTEKGRSDTMLVATVNKKQVTLISLPRDTYTEIVGRGTKDKMNHAYAFGGAAMSMDTVSNLLDIPIDHYVMINMQGLKDLVDGVGGVTVDNSFEFNSQGTTFPAGSQKLNGEDALKYSRMRYEDPNGDYGRQERQRQVIQGVIQKVLSLNGLTNYQKMLVTLGQNGKTDLSFNDMQDIVKNYHNAFNTFKTDQLKGEGFMQDGISYQEISDVELKRVQTELKEQLS